jgi:GTPase SAR1 family protein
MGGGAGKQAKPSRSAPTTSPTFVNGHLNPNFLRRALGKALAKAKTTFKILIVGAPKAGKSSVFKRLIKSTFDHATLIPNNPAELGLKLIYANNKMLTLELWDVPSTHAVQDLLQDTFLSGTDAAIVVADCTDTTSFREVSRWRELLFEHEVRDLPRELILLTLTLCVAAQNTS